MVRSSRQRGADPWVAPLSSWTLERPREIELTLPAHLPDISHDAELSLRTEAALPPAARGHDLALTIPYYAGAADLLVDDVPAPRVDSSLFDGHRSAGPLVFRVTGDRTRGASIKLRLLVHVRWTQSGWLDTVPLLSLAETHPVAAIAVHLVNEVIGVLGSAALLQLGLSYAAAYAMQRTKRRAHLLFAIQVLAASYYTLYGWGVTELFLGRYEAVGLAISLGVANVASIHLTHEQFGLGPPSRWWGAALLAVTAITLLWSGPYETSRMAAVPIVLISGTISLYQIRVLGKLGLAKPRPAGSRTLLVLWVVIALTTSFDGMGWLGLGEPLGGVHIGCLGLAVFGLINGFLLGQEHTASLDRSDALNQTLERRVEQLESGRREIEALNVVLQRQIGDRTQQLCAALALTSDGVHRAAALVPGSRVCDRYEIVRRLGRGGMGTVFEAIRLLDGRRFALKIAHEHGGVALARVAREAYLASRISHPNVVKIHDVDVEPAGFLFLVLEYVEGGSLRDMVARFADAGFACDVFRQIALGLSTLHAATIVHRDLKPENVLVHANAASLHVKLADFGISRLAFPVPPSCVEETWRPPSRGKAPGTRRADERPDSANVSEVVRTGRTSGDSSLTERGKLVGTPAYVAPELALLGALVEPPSDIFSFGVMAFEVLVGRLPYEGSLALRHASGDQVPPPPSLVGLRPDLPRALTEALDRCMDLEPSVRPTAVELARLSVIRVLDAA